MISPEQIPDEVVNALWLALLGRPLSARNCTAAIAAALNAWPGVRPASDPPPARLIIPLPQESSA